MQTVQLRDRRQITLPPAVVAQLGLSTADELEVCVVGNVVQLRPLATARPALDVRQFVGSCAGVWGNSVEEIDRNIAADRDSLERDVWAAA